MTMLRKIRRSVARHNMEQQDIHIFGKYTTTTEKKKVGRLNKYKEDTVQKSFFSKAWRAYL